MKANPIKVSEHAKVIDLWMKYCYNYRAIQFDWTNREGYVHAPEMVIYLGEHFVDKWDSLKQKHESGTLGLIYFWYELSSNYQQKAVEWLMLNYKG